MEGRRDEEEDREEKEISGEGEGISKDRVIPQDEPEVEAKA